MSQSDANSQAPNSPLTSGSAGYFGGVMNSKNFEFLRPTHPELADLAGFAEQYLYTDPDSSFVKLRKFAEYLVKSVYHHHHLARDNDSGKLIDLLTAKAFTSATPRVVIDKLHLVRQRGNRAAHGDVYGDKQAIASSLLQDCYDIGRWLHVNLNKAALDSIPAFKRPSQEDVDTKGALKRAKRNALQKLAAQEAKMDQVLEQLEAARAEAKKNAEAADKTQTELDGILAQAQSAADVLKFDEATTRKLLIDERLVQAGWNVGRNGEGTDEVTQEHLVPHQPTNSEEGKADYVLWNDDATPLGVIEAKRAAKDAEDGKNQARIYADGLEKEHGVRPVIFFTNGGEIHMWDDTRNEPPRRVYGFYSKASLQYNLSQRRNRQEPLDEFNPSDKIVNRGLYQIEAIKRVTGTFQQRRRKALIIQATGTGKTRVAIALCEIMIRAGWVKRILFLCDRRELRKQARNAFQEHLPGEPAVYVTSKTAGDTTKRIYLATYPAMMKCFERFDVGFFDLVIADESHRSVYNRYRSLFTYFDAFQVGLTATPLKFVERNTYKLFGCDDKDPTTNFSYTDAIEHDPPFLCEFRVVNVTTKFLREGIRYQDLTEEQRREADEQAADSESIDYTREQVSRKVFSLDTDRLILRNLMEHGIRNAEGTRIGKTIVFARNHQHAKNLVRMFDEMYPQYGGDFCQRIDNYEPRAEQLISDFKSNDGSQNLTIAVSVDMLDTGIDVPEVVNLVFAKPVKSYAKFWQMIGRGTRLCKNLLGPGKDKKEFLIFDHWGNFEYFKEEKKEVEPTRTKSLTEKVFEARIALAEAAREHQDLDAFQQSTQLLASDVASLPDRSIAIQEQWREVTAVRKEGSIEAFHPGTVATLRQTIAPLMQWRARDIRESALEFDHLVAKLQTATLAKTANRDDLRGELVARVSKLPINLKPVQEKIAVIEQVKNSKFWEQATATDLESVRRELRSIMRYRERDTTPRAPLVYLDITEDEAEVAREAYIPTFEGLDLVNYRHRVNGILEALFEQSPALQKIRRAEPLSGQDIEELAQAVVLQDPDLTLEDLARNFGGRTQNIEIALRRVVGLEPAKVDAHFKDFAQSHPTLRADQIRFLELLKAHIAKYGAIELEKLWENPFTQLNSDGIDGVFPDADSEEIIRLIKEINGDADESSTTY